jgi:phage terminase large subunit-like protein
MVRYDDDYNPILLYHEEIVSGREVVPKKIARLVKKLVRDIQNPGKYFYSPARANHMLEFAENYCRHSKGELGGQKIRLELWEKAFLASAFGFIDARGYRQYREVILLVGKKNGKSLLASIIGLYLMVADGEPGAEIYALATKRDQAKIIWGEARRMVRQSPELRRRIKTLVGEMTYEASNAIFRPLASDKDTLDGLNVSGAMMDEIQQWKSGNDLYDIIARGVSARRQPMILITSTSGVIRGDFYDDKYDEAAEVIKGYDDPNGRKNERLLPWVYELDKRSEWTDPSCWKKANPGLGTIKNAETLAEEVEKARHNPARLKNLLCKDFNIPETAGGAWMEPEQFENKARFCYRELRPRYGIGGVDLSSTTDLTAAKVIFRVPGDEHIYVLSMYWIPSDTVEKHVHEDHIPYDLFIQKGLMRTVPGNKIIKSYVTDWFKEIRYDYDIYLPWIGYDAWSSEDWVDEMRGVFGAEAMVPVRQGKRTFSTPMRELQADFEKRLIVYNNNPLDRWCFGNTAKDEDINGNIQPVHSTVATRRVDGMFALLDAYVVYLDNKSEYEYMI